MNQGNDDDRVLKDAKSRINALLGGKIPDTMDVTSYSSELGASLAGSINVLINSFLVINDVIISASGEEQNKSMPCDGSSQSLPSNGSQDYQVQFAQQVEEVAKDNNNSQCIDFKGGNWERLNTMFEQLRMMEGTLNESIKDLAKGTKAVFRERISPLSDKESEDD